MPWRGRTDAEIEIRGKRWRWTVVGPEERGARGRRRRSASPRAFVAFRDPDDPASEMRCPVPDDAGEELTEPTLRELFRRAWAVRS